MNRLLSAMARSVFCRALVLACLIAMLGCQKQRQKGGPRDTRPAPGTVSAQGRIEPVGGIVLINGPTGERVLRIDKHEGDPIKHGDELIVLESQTIRNQEVQLAEAQLAEAKKRAKAVEQQALAQEAEAKLKLDRIGLNNKLDLDTFAQREGVLQSQAELAERTLKRMEEVPGSYPQVEVDKQGQAAKAAKADLAIARLQQATTTQVNANMLAEAKEQAKALAASGEQARVTASTIAAQLNVEQARFKRDQSLIKCPLEKGGVVLSVQTHEGEMTGARPLMRIGDTSSLVVVAEFQETDIVQIQEGDLAEIQTSLFLDPNKIDGKVTRISRLIAQGNLQDINPASRTDKRVGEVRIEITPNEKTQELYNRLKRLINMQVKVTIDTNKRPAGKK